VRVLKSGKQSLESLIKAVKDSGTQALPVESWQPEFCGEMDMVIRKDGSWWHEGTRITREPLIRLFAKVLRKDNDGQTYLVTPVEKIRIRVECAPFLAIRLDAKGKGETQRLFFTTNVGDVVEAGPEHPIRVDTDRETLEPTPFVHIRGRLEALLTRPVFYELVELAVERTGPEGPELGVWAGGQFFALGPAGLHNGGQSV